MKLYGIDSMIPKAMTKLYVKPISWVTRTRLTIKDILEIGFIVLLGWLAVFFTVLTMLLLSNAISK